MKSLKRVNPLTSRLILILAIAGLFFVPELFAGNKFEVMGKGVTGVERIKKETLETIGLIFGGFFIISGIIITLLRKKVAKGVHVNYWWQGVPYYISFIIIGFGVLISLPYFF